MIEYILSWEKNSIVNIFFFAFKQGSKDVKTVRDICSVYGEGAIAETTIHDWYANLRNGNFQKCILFWPSIEFEEERLNQLVHENTRQITRELAEKIFNP